MLEAHGCWAPFWQVESPTSELDPKREVPFAGGHSQTGVDGHRAEKAPWRWVPPVKPASRSGEKSLAK